jgi:hypothetical protein
MIKFVIKRRKATKAFVLSFALSEPPIYDLKIRNSVTIAIFDFDSTGITKLTTQIFILLPKKKAILKVSFLRIFQIQIPRLRGDASDGGRIPRRRRVLQRAQRHNYNYSMTTTFFCLNIMEYSFKNFVSYKKS